MKESRPIGLIGIGLLGSALAERLLADGGRVLGFDTNTDQLAALSDLGGTAVDEVAEVVRHCPILFLSLPTSATVAALLDQLEPEFQPGQIVIDTTTGDPAQMILIGRTLDRWGVHYVEALVAGSSAQVRTGKVVLFVGGEDRAVTQVKPLFAAITETHFHLGAIGAASPARGPIFRMRI